MTIRTIYHAPDGEQFPSRAEAQQYERALAFLDWWASVNIAPIVSNTYRRDLAKRLAERWYFRDKEARPVRGKPAFTGRACSTCGGAMEMIAAVEVCVNCDPKGATELRRKEQSNEPLPPPPQSPLPPEKA